MVGIILHQADSGPLVLLLQEIKLNPSQLLPALSHLGVTDVEVCASLALSHLGVTDVEVCALLAGLFEGWGGGGDFGCVNKMILACYSRF